MDAGPGDLDLGFGIGGRIRTNYALTVNGMPPYSADTGYAVLIQPDDKIVVVGVSNEGGTGGDAFTLLRYKPDGTLDTDFGTGGLVKTYAPELDDGTALAAALQPDNKIVAAGFAFPLSGGGDNDFALARYLPDGTLDPDFGSGGIVTTGFPGFDTTVANGVAVHSNGQIVAVGSQSDPSAAPWAVARYNPDGTLDGNFGNAGGVTTPIVGDFDRAQAVVIDPDGKVVVAGRGWDGSSNTGYFVLTRYNAADGSLDATFGGDGVVTTPFPDPFGCTFDAPAAALALARQPDGKYVAAGYACSESIGRIMLVLARYNPDGTLDSMFGNGGIATTLDPSTGNAASAVAIASDGKLVVVGDPGFTVYRYNPDGTLDATFGTGGSIQLDFSACMVFVDSLGHAVAIQPDRKIVVTGTTTGLGYDCNSHRDFATARLDGTTIPLNKCAGSKIKAACKKVTCKTKLEAKQASNGGTIEPALVAKCESKFSSTFAKLESQGGCLTSGDSSAIEAKVDALVLDLDSELDVPSQPNKCEGTKLKAAAKKASCKCNLEAKLATNGEPPAPAQTAKCESKFSSSFAKAEAMGGCNTTGDTTAIEGKIDAFVEDVDEELLEGHGQ